MIMSVYHTVITLIKYMWPFKIGIELRLTSVIMLWKKTTQIKTNSFLSRACYSKGVSHHHLCLGRVSKVGKV